MITVGFEELVTIHVVLIMLVLGAAWGRHMWAAGAQSWRLSRERLCRCRSCGFVFISKRIETAVRCPHCDELNRVPPRKAKKEVHYHGANNGLSG